MKVGPKSSLRPFLHRALQLSTIESSCLQFENEVHTTVVQHCFYTDTLPVHRV